LIQWFIVNYFHDLTARKCNDLAVELDTLHVQRSLEASFTYIVIVDENLFFLNGNRRGIPLLYFY
jgi:hypothetical protein